MGKAKRWKQSTSPIDKSFELFDCDGEQMNDEVDVEPESDDESDNNEDEDAVTTTNNNEKKQTATKTPQAPVILADLCEENCDLKGDAMFLGCLGTSATQTSNHLLHFLDTFKRNYVVARKAIREQIQ